MGRKTVAIFIVATIIAASLALAVIPFGANDDSPVKYSESGVSTQSVPSVEDPTQDESGEASPSEEEETEAIEIDEKAMEKAEQSAYVSADLTAYLTGTAELPIITVVGNTHSSELKNADLPTFSSYYTWISNNITGGKNIKGDYGFGCSAFHVNTSGGHFVGRNLDYDDAVKWPMVLKCVPTDGYASIGLTAKAMVFSESDSLDTMAGSSELAGAVMMPFDGMNEKGFTCSLLMIEYDSGYESKDGSICALAMTRYLLDYADSVATAERLITEIGFSSFYPWTGSMHLYITDKAGNAEAVEVVGGELCFTPTEYITNHFISEQSDLRVCNESQSRFDILKNCLDGKDVITMEDCMNALKAAKVSPYPWRCIWSIVFDVDNLKLNVWYEATYDVNPVQYDISQLVAIRDAEETEIEIVTEEESETA